MRTEEQNTKRHWVTKTELLDKLGIEIPAGYGSTITYSNGELQITVSSNKTVTRDQFVSGVDK